MSSTADEGASQTAARLGFTSGQVVQEFGYDDDVDDELRASLETVTGTELVDEEYDDVTDGAVIWFRDGDGDLTDALVDAMTVLDDGGPDLGPHAEGGPPRARVPQRHRGGGDDLRAARHEHLLDRARLVRHPARRARPRPLTAGSHGSAVVVTVRAMDATARTTPRSAHPPRTSRSPTPTAPR